MSSKTAGGANIRVAGQWLTAQGATIGMRSFGQPCICLHTSFLSLERPVAMPSRIASDQWAGRTTDEHLTSLTPLTDRPVSIPNKRAYTRFSERTGDNADKSAVPRKKFHSTGMVLASEETPARPAKRADRPGPPERTGIVGWHGYCTEHVIRGDRSEFSSGFSGWDLPGSPVTTSSGK